MSRYRYEMGGIIRDTEIDFPYPTDDIIELLDDKDQKIADLEAKLAESEKKFKASKDAIKFQNEEQKEWMGKYFDTAIKLEKANKQLAEKENTITNLIEDSNASKELLKKQLNEQAGLCEEFRFQLEEKDKEIEYLNKQARKFNNEAQKYFEDAYCNDTIYQDKISFAVEKLEKVKAVLNELFENEHGCYVIIDTLDNQIEELKKEMK